MDLLIVAWILLASEAETSCLTFVGVVVGVVVVSSAVVGSSLSAASRFFSLK